MQQSFHAQKLAYPPAPLQRPEQLAEKRSLNSSLSSNPGEETRKVDVGLNVVEPCSHLLTSRILDLFSLCQNCPDSILQFLQLSTSLVQFHVWTTECLSGVLAEIHQAQDAILRLKEFGKAVQGASRLTGTSSEVNTIKDNITQRTVMCYHFIRLLVC